jgi:V8-like Glu-specific endopeptidase
MKRRPSILIIMVALIAAVVLQATPALAIIGGEFDGNGHPYVGALDLRPTGRRIPCTGTLISPTVFLTAGHCTTFLDQVGLTEARVTFDPVFSDNAKFYTGSVHTNPLYIPFHTGSQQDPGDFGVIVFSEPVIGITPASLPTAGVLDQLGPQGLHNVVFPTVGYGITRLLGGSNGGGPPSPDRNSAGRRMVATQTFFSLTDAWLRLSMLGDGRVCTGDSGAPNFLGDTDLVVAIHITGDSACEALNATLRLDTPTARAFLGQFVELP